jgi:hypothetical protein
VPERRERVGPRRDGLRREGRGGPEVRHLPGDDAAHVALEWELVHDLEPAPWPVDHERAPVAGAVEREDGGAGDEAERERPADDPAAAYGKDTRSPAPVGDAVRLLGADRDGAAAAHDEDAHRHAVLVLQRRPGVVVGEDLPVAPPVQCIALRAPLAHADAVAPAATVDHEGRRARGSGERERCRCRSEDAHRARDYPL